MLKSRNINSTQESTYHQHKDYFETQRRALHYKNLINQHKTSFQDQIKGPENVSKQVNPKLSTLPENPSTNKIIQLQQSKWNQVKLVSKSRDKIKAVHNIKEQQFIQTNIETGHRVIPRRKQSEESKAKLVVTLKKSKDVSSLTRIGGSIKLPKKQSIPSHDPSSYLSLHSQSKLKQNTSYMVESGSMKGRKFSLEKKEVKSCERMKKRKSLASLSKQNTFMNPPTKSESLQQGITQIKDKPQLKTYSVQSTTCQMQSEFILVDQSHSRFLSTYEDSLIQKHLSVPNDICCYSINEKHPQITDTLRAKLIDWVLHCAKTCYIDDKNVFFTVIHLIDKYYSHVPYQQNRESLQLTAVSAILIASKLLQVDHLKLDFCHSNLGHYKYTYKQISDKENELLSLSNYEIFQSPTLFESFELLISLLKNKVQHHISRLEIIDYIMDLQSLSYQLVRASLISTANYKVQNIFRAASLIQLALAFNAVSYQREDKYIIQEILVIMNAWKGLVEDKLKLDLASLKKIGFAQLNVIMLMELKCGNKLADVASFSLTFREWATSNLISHYRTQNSMEERYQRDEGAADGYEEDEIGNELDHVQVIGPNQ